MPTYGVMSTSTGSAGGANGSAISTPATSAKISR